MTKKQTGYRLEKGFLVDYNWSAVMDLLEPADFKTLFIELRDFQRSGGRQPVPEHRENLLMFCLREMAVPQIEQRLQGAQRCAPEASAQAEETQEEKKTAPTPPTQTVKKAPPTAPSAVRDRAGKAEKLTPSGEMTAKAAAPRQEECIQEQAAFHALWGA